MQQRANYVKPWYYYTGNAKASTIKKRAKRNNPKLGYKISAAGKC